LELAALSISKQYAVSEDLSADCLWEGLFPNIYRAVLFVGLGFRFGEFLGPIPRRGGNCLNSKGLQATTVGTNQLVATLGETFESL